MEIESLFRVETWSIGLGQKSKIRLQIWFIPSFRFRTDLRAVGAKFFAPDGSGARYT